MVTLMTKKEF
jgi:hypothetical protein